MMDSQYDFGMIGLGVMGSNLLLNMADHGFATIGFDLDDDKCVLLEANARPGTIVKGVNSLSTMVQALKIPRKILLLVPAGKPVDDVIESLLPLIEEGDIVIDGGNSFYLDTMRRVSYLDSRGIHFMGMGISGGEQGARLGASMMPGGNQQAFEAVKPMLEAVAAKSDGVPCFAYMGYGAAGHFVKMVHNGIEYAMMQIICEAYDILKRGGGYTNDELQLLFSKWNEGQLQSFLIEITASVFKNKDAETNEYLVDLILDKAGSKGTGKWTSQEALNLPVAIPSIDAAVAARIISGYKKERQKAAEIYQTQVAKIIISKESLAEAVEEALTFSFIIAYAQGLSMIAKASIELNMNIHLPAVIQVWKAGCIIRSGLLVHFAKVYEANNTLANLLLSTDIAALLKQYENNTRLVLTAAIGAKIPVAGFMSTLAYFDSYCSERLPTNLLQAQRDYFGAHTYQRIDKDGIFHSEWQE
ncbi:MAG: NADP-dependent phosphogluconate dehydrogenase [Bacteroidota bacterium]